MNREVEKFVKDYVKHLHDGDAAIFAGAGLSVGSGYVNWRELLKEIADDLDLDIEKESDLISIAQYHTNKHGRNKISTKILDEFSHQAKEDETHRIIARLPITTIWTTNYDTLIEDTYKKIGKRPDVKYSEQNLAINLARKDVTIYKMHGDVNSPKDAVITKYDYEKYHRTHASYITALSSDLLTKTFLFLGFSFTDPNIDHIISRVRLNFNDNFKNHYCIIKRIKLGEKGSEDQAKFDYNTTKQSLMIEELARFHINTLLIDAYPEVISILAEIEKQYKRRTVFISGSAISYGEHSESDAIGFVHKLCSSLVKKNFTIVNGFGLGIGSAVINGALEAIYSEPHRYSEAQLIMRPFPQFQTGKLGLRELWQEYRERMIKFAGICIIIFGNKHDDQKNIINAPGVLSEFEIAKSQGAFVIPIAATGFQARIIWEQLKSLYAESYPELTELFSKLENDAASLESHIESIIEIISLVNKK